MNQDNHQLSRRTLLSQAAIGAGAAVALLGVSALPSLAQEAVPAAPVPAAPPAEPTLVPMAPEPAPAPAAAGPTVASEPEAPATPAATITASDLEIANFALGLERLEAAYYAQIQGAQQARAYLTPRYLEIAASIGAIEIAHVTALETAIIAAGGTPAPAATYRFPSNVFISPVAFAWFGHTLEEIGIGAYLGAVGQIKDAGLRRAAASIYGAEVRHAAVLRSVGGFTFAPRYFETSLSVAQVQGLIAPYLA